MRKKETDSGTFDVPGTQWNSAAGKFTYQRSQNDLIVTIKDMNKKEWRMAA